jgi:hypothetical protein
MVSVLRASRVDREPLLHAALPLAFLGVLFLYPVVRFLLISVDGGSLAQYDKALFDGLYLRVLADTFRIALIVTLITLILGYPIAYSCRPRHRGGHRRSGLPDPAVLDQRADPNLRMVGDPGAKRRGEPPAALLRGR